jgi:hypothetical protein
LAVRKKEKGKQEKGIVIHSWKQSNQHKPLVKIQSAQVVKIQSAPTTLGLSLLIGCSGGAYELLCQV